MNIMDIIGTIGTIFLGICMIPELVATVIRGECLMSLWTLSVWVSGLILLLSYTCKKFGWDWILHVNYLANIGIGLILIWYKF